MKKGLCYFRHFAFLSLLLIASPLLAHKGEKHTKTETEKMEPPPALKNAEEDAYKEINESYLSQVKPIFQKSCFDCHGSNPQIPWYGNLLGAKQLIASDIAEASKHLDLTSDFPFKSHSTPKDDLEAIRDAVTENSMPPFRYRMMHWNSSLSETDKSTILKWTEESLSKLEEQTEEAH